MPCDTRLKLNQTVKQRVAEVQKAIVRINDLVAARKALVKVGPQGAIAFQGIPDDVRDGVTDGCIYRRLMVSGSALARQQIERAEILAGRKVDKKVIGIGVHSHDGGATWHDHKG